MSFVNEIENLIKRFFEKFYWRQHPEAALRYIPVVSELKKANLADSKILEVGSGSLGIVPYLKRPIDGIDIDFSGPKTELLSKIKADAFDIPYRKNSYEVAISVDVLEHLPDNKREEAVYELLRVVKKLAILVVPIGELSEEQDKILHKHWNKVFGEQNQFLDEHVKYGLPRTEKVLVFIDKSLRRLKKEAKVHSYPNLNLFIRSVLMHTWITKSKILYYVYLKGFLLLVPILRFANFGNCYRRVFVIEFTS